VPLFVVASCGDGNDFEEACMTVGDTRIADLQAWLGAQEGEHFEFKEARRSFEFDELTKYCCALANEGGGRVLLGVSDQRPRRVVGSAAFQQPERTRLGLIDRLHLDVKVLEILHPDGRVLVFEVPGRPIGVPIQWDGRYWSRRGDSLIPLTPAQLRATFAESGHDFSADTCPTARLEDLDPAAIEDFRLRWMEKSRNPGLASLSQEQLLRDAELLSDQGLTYAAVILFGTRPALGRLLAQAEVIFEYRSSETSGPAQERKEYRQGFFTFYDALWDDIAKRNDLQHYQDGLFVKEIPTFDERAVREALLNAVSHRDYQLAGSAFVRQFPRRLVMESPGGLPWGITPENILNRQSPRNRRLAEAFARCGLVDRAGQGVNLMFERSIRQGKQQPDFTDTDAFQVVLTLHGEVGDPRFVQFLEKVGQETLESFTTQDFLVMDLLHREQSVPEELRSRLPRLRDLGIIESVGQGRGTRYLLSRRFYSFLGERGAYTRRRGLDRAHNKELLLRHIRDSGAAGCPISELEQVLPALSRGNIGRLLQGLRKDGHISPVGKLRWTRWVATGEGQEGSSS